MKFSTSFIDLFLILLFTFVVLWFLSTLLISVKDQETPSPKHRAEYIVTVTWDNAKNCDVDTWMMRDGYPESICGYRRREVDVFILHNDNTSSSYGFVNGKPLKRALETLSIEQIVSGKYLLSLHGYRITQPVTVSVRVERTSPYKTLFVGEVEMTESREYPILSFKLDKEGNPSEIERREAMLSPFLRALQQEQR